MIQIGQWLLRFVVRGNLEAVFEWLRHIGIHRSFPIPVILTTLNRMLIAGSRIAPEWSVSTAMFFPGVASQPESGFSFEFLRHASSFRSDSHSLIRPLRLTVSSAASVSQCTGLGPYCLTEPFVTYVPHHESGLRGPACFWRDTTRRPYGGHNGIRGHICEYPSVSVLCRR